MTALLVAIVFTGVTCCAASIDLWRVPAVSGALHPVAHASLRSFHKSLSARKHRAGDVKSALSAHAPINHTYFHEGIHEGIGYMKLDARGALQHKTVHLDEFALLFSDASPAPVWDCGVTEEEEVDVVTFDIKFGPTQHTGAAAAAVDSVLAYLFDRLSAPRAMLTWGPRLMLLHEQRPLWAASCPWPDKPYFHVLSASLAGSANEGAVLHIVAGHMPSPLPLFTHLKHDLLFDGNISRAVDARPHVPVFSATGRRLAPAEVARALAPPNDPTVTGQDSQQTFTQKLASFDWNYDSPGVAKESPLAIMDGVDANTLGCWTCYVHLGVSISASIDYTLPGFTSGVIPVPTIGSFSQVGAYVEGNMDVRATIQLNPSTAGYTAETIQTLVDNLKGAPISFSVGSVPITIYTYLTVKAIASAKAVITGNFSYSAFVMGQVDAGFVYNSVKLNPPAQLISYFPPPTYAVPAPDFTTIKSASLNVALTIQPMLVISLYDSIPFTLTVDPTVSLSIATTTPGCTGMGVDIKFGVTATVGVSDISWENILGNFNLGWVSSIPGFDGNIIDAKTSAPITLLAPTPLVSTCVPLGSLCGTCPASASRFLQLASSPSAASTANMSITLAQLYSSCGAVCSAPKASIEPALAVSGLTTVFDDDYNAVGLVFSWDGSATGSILDATNHSVNASLYWLSAGAQAVNMSALWGYSRDGTTTTTNTLSYSAPASVRTLALPWEWELEFEQLPWVTCADSSILALSISNGTGYVVATIYSPPFSICYGYTLGLGFSANIEITYPLDEDAIQPFAGRDTMTIKWTSMWTPWDAAWDVQLQGYDADMNAVTATVGSSVPVTSANLKAVFNTNGDGTGSRYSYTFPTPALADDGVTSLAGLYLLPYVMLTNDTASERLSDSWVFMNDPAQLTTQLTVVAPIYGATFSNTSTLYVNWTGSGLLPADTLVLDLVNIDSGDSWSWAVSSATAGSYALNLADFSAQVEPWVFPLVAASDPRPIPFSINFQCYLTLFRPAFVVSGSSNFFKILPPDAPTVQVVPDDTQLFLGEALTVNFFISDMRALLPFSARTATVSLWLSTTGEHDPNGDVFITNLSTSVPIVGGGIGIPGIGSVKATLPLDPLFATAATYFFTMQSNDVPYIAAASVFVSVGPPTLTILSPSATVSTQCGGAVKISWNGTGLFSPPTPLTFDLYQLDATTKRDVFVTTIATGVSPGSISTRLNNISIALPFTMPTAQYVIYGFNGANYTSSLASSKSGYFVVACAKVYSIETPPSFTAGDHLIVPYFAQNVPPATTLTVWLIDPTKPNDPPTVLSDGERNSGFFLWPTDPTLTYSSRYLKIGDPADSMTYGVSGSFAALPPAASITITAVPSDSWTAGTPARITWSSTGLSPKDMCELELWSKTSDFIGASKVMNITNSIRCNATGTKWVPPTLLSVVPSYFVVISTSDQTVLARTEPFALTNGTSPLTLSATLAESTTAARRLVMNEGSNLPRRLSVEENRRLYEEETLGATEEARARARRVTELSFPDLPSSVVSIIHAPNCSACVAAGGAYVINTQLTFTFDVEGFVGSDGDLDDFITQLGAITTSDNFCWVQPAAGQSRSVRTISLGSMLSVNEMLASFGLSDVTATAKFVLNADVTGTTDCATLDTASMSVQPDTPVDADFDAAAYCNAIIGAVSEAGGSSVQPSDVICSFTSAHVDFTPTLTTPPPISRRELYGTDLVSTTTSSRELLDCWCPSAPIVALTPAPVVTPSFTVSTTVSDVGKSLMSGWSSFGAAAAAPAARRTLFDHVPETFVGRVLAANNRSKAVGFKKAGKLEKTTQAQAAKTGKAKAKVPTASLPKPKVKTGGVTLKGATLRSGNKTTQLLVGGSVPSTTTLKEQLKKGTASSPIVAKAAKASAPRPIVVAILSASNTPSSQQSSSKSISRSSTPSRSPISVTPSPTRTPSMTPSSSPTATLSVGASPSKSPTSSKTSSRSATTTPSTTPTVTTTPTPTSSLSRGASPSWTPTATPSRSAMTQTQTPSGTATQTPTGTMTSFTGILGAGMSSNDTAGGLSVTSWALICSLGGVGAILIIIGLLMCSGRLSRGRERSSALSSSKSLDTGAATNPLYSYSPARLPLGRGVPRSRMEGVLGPSPNVSGRQLV